MTSGKTKLTITITLAVLLGIGIFVFQLIDRNQPRLVVKEIPVATPAPAGVNGVAPNKTASAKTQGVDKIAATTESVVKIAPQPEAIRSEVAKDPHHTPRSLLIFASELGDRMDQAIQTNEAASRFFTELSDCVSSAEFKSAPSVRAICLSNARLLTQRVPELEPNFQQLYDNTDSEITKLAP